MVIRGAFPYDSASWPQRRVSPTSLYPSASRSWLCRCSRLQNDKTGCVRQSASHEPRIRSGPAEIRRVAGPAAAPAFGLHPFTRGRDVPFFPVPIRLRARQNCRGSRTPSRETRRVRPAKPGRAAGPPSPHMSSGHPLLDVDITLTPLSAYSVSGNPAGPHPGRRSLVPDHDLPPFGTKFDASLLNGSSRCPSVASNDPQVESFETCNTPSFSVSESLDPPSPSGRWLETLHPPDCCHRTITSASTGPQPARR